MSNVAIVTTIPHLSEIFKDVENIELLSRLMLTLPSLSIAILAPFIGHLVHNVGKKKSATFALILFAVTGSAGLYLDDINSLLASRALLGISIATLMIVSTSLVGDYFKDEARHKFMGIQSAFVSFGGVLFVVGGGILSDISWQYPFGIYLIGFILLPFVMLYLKEKTNFKYESISSEVAVPTKLYHIYLLAFLLMSIFYILPTQMPFLMINVFEASGTLTGAIISLAFVFHALGSLSFAKLKRKYHFRTIYILGMFIISCGFIFISIVENIYLFFISAAILGLGGGLMMTNINGWMLSLANHSKRVKSSGYLTSSFFMGQFFSPILTMPFVSYFGVQKTFMIFGFSIIIGVVISIFYQRQ
jgi:MFS family permease